jgi:hypothetical protein
MTMPKGFIDKTPHPRHEDVPMSDSSTGDPKGDLKKAKTYGSKPPAKGVRGGSGGLY